MNSTRVAVIASEMIRSTDGVTDLDMTSKARWNGLTESIRLMLMSSMLTNFSAILMNRLSPTSRTSPFLITESTTTCCRSSSTCDSSRSGYRSRMIFGISTLLVVSGSTEPAAALAKVSSCRIVAFRSLRSVSTICLTRSVDGSLKPLILMTPGGFGHRRRRCAWS